MYHVMAEDGRKTPKYKTVVGQLIAFSHAFRTKPQAAFMEIRCENELCHIASRRHLTMFKNLTLGNMYKITHLLSRQMEYADAKTVCILETTAESSFVLFLDAGPILEPSLDMANYEGTIVESCPSLGMYKFHDNVDLCFAFLMHYSDVPLPAVGQNVSVFNAHWWNSQYDKYDLVLCGRSCVVLQKWSVFFDITSHFLYLFPVARDRESTEKSVFLMDINVNCAYTDVLWLKKQLTQFEKKFNSEFLGANDMLRKPVSELQQEMLVQTVNKLYPVNEEDTEKRFISREFVCSPHRCVVTQPRTFAGNYMTLHELWEQASFTCNPLSSKSWSYHISHYAVGLVGHLIGSSCNGYWILSDATKSIPCLLTSDAEDLVAFHGVVVLITKCTLVIEMFQNVNFTYIHFAAKDIHVIYTPDSCCGDTCRLKGDCGTLASSSKVNRICNNISTEGNKSMLKMKTTFKYLDVENIIGCNLLNKKRIVTTDSDWLIVVLHKTTPAKISELEAPSCCLLINMIGTLKEVEDGSYSTKRHYLMLAGNLLKFVPLLKNNSLYVLSLPGNVPSHHQPCTLKQRSMVLPNVWGVCIPEDSVFSAVNTQQQEVFGVKFDSYSISDRNLWEEAGQKEPVNVEGVICDRLHTDVKFESENTSHLPGYGIPGNKNIILKLQDPTFGYSEEVSLYLCDWSYRAYPFGLVPGARICAFFVTKHKSQNSSLVYFRATKLTRIEVLFVPQSSEIKERVIYGGLSDDWGESCILAREAVYAAAGSLLWGSLSMVKVFKLTVVTTCSYCTCLLRNGCCTSCSSYPPLAKLSVKATCCMEDVFGRVLIYMKEEHVCQLLGLSMPYWNVLAKLISLDGSEITLPQDEWNPLDTIGKQVLQALLKTVDKQQRRFQILCRKIKINNSNMKYEELPRLYCLALRKPVPALLYPLHKRKN